MKIDVTERIENAIRLTNEWAERAGYREPPEAPTEFSKKANDLRRILEVSNFGCQQRNVHAILQVLIDEKFPCHDRDMPLADYARREPFAIGSVLVPVDGTRPGAVVRLSQSGNAGLRKSSGEMYNNHYQQGRVRPATEGEIRVYFDEFFGLSTNPEDEPRTEESDVEVYYPGDRGEYGDDLAW